MNYRHLQDWLIHTDELEILFDRDPAFLDLTDAWLTDMREQVLDVVEQPSAPRFAWHGGRASSAYTYHVIHFDLSMSDRVVALCGDYFYDPVNLITDEPDWTKDWLSLMDATEPVDRYLCSHCRKAQR